MIRIDKSLFTPEELEQYEALVAKATVDPEANQEEMKNEVPAPPNKKTTEKAEVEDMDETKKSDTPTANPEMEAAMKEFNDLKKSFEMKEMTEVAKKYAPLGKKEDELAKTLYEMKKSNEANYNAYIAILDDSLDLVNKSGLFAEVGKSAGAASTSGSAVEKAQAKAKEIMKADPNVNYTTAIAKAWEDPELMAEYDAEYKN